MTRQTMRRLLLVSLLLTLAGTSRAQGDAGKAQAGFTGEMKPVIYVTDVEKSAPFYRDVLGFGFDGFANAEGQPYYAEMIAGRVKFGLHEPMTGADRPKVGHLRLYFRVVDLEAERSRVQAHGGAPDEIRKTSWMDMFTVLDPDGNEIVFGVTDPERHSMDPWSTGMPAPGSK